MRVCYVCKAVDETNSTVATQVRWIRALAEHPRVDHLVVLTTHLGRADLPGNVIVRPFGAEGWPRTVTKFYREALRLVPSRLDCFFVAQGGPYPALLLPLKTILRLPLYQWKAHPHISRRMRFYARWCDDLVFTPTSGSFPMKLSSLRVVGHGIDTDQFQPADSPKERDLAAVGRIAAVKHLDLAMKALAVCRDEWGLHLTLDIVGEPAVKDRTYSNELHALVERLDLADQVRFLGAVAHDDLPSLLGRYRATLNLSQTAFDKAAGESMAMGVPVITTNACTAEMLPSDLRDPLVADDDAWGVAWALREVICWDDVTRHRVGQRLREVVVQGHSLDLLFDKILCEIDRHGRG